MKKIAVSCSILIINYGDPYADIKLCCAWNINLLGTGGVIVTGIF